MIHWIILSAKEVLSSRLITLIVFCSAVVAFLSVAFLLIIGGNADRYIRDKFSTAIPPNAILVTPSPAPQALFGFALRSPEGTVLDDSRLKAIRALRGVRTVYPLLASQIPLQATISIFGLRYRTDLICIGAPYEYISGDIKKPEQRRLWRSWKAGASMPLPSLLPEILLDAYNNSMAVPNGLPRITADFASGQKFEILFGKSSIKTVEGFFAEPSVVAGVTRKISSICLVIPLSAMRHYNGKFGGAPGGSHRYMSALVEVRGHDGLLGVSRAISKMGFVVETEKTISREIQQLKSGVAMFLGAVTWIILTLAVIALGFSTVIATLDRMEYYRILRVLGASRFFIAATILIKYALLGLCGALAGQAVLGVLTAAIGKTVIVPGFTLQTRLSPELLARMTLAGVLLPMASTLPALIKMNWKSMSGD